MLKIKWKAKYGMNSKNILFCKLLLTNCLELIQKKSLKKIQNACINQAKTPIFAAPLRKTDA